VRTLQRSSCNPPVSALTNHVAFPDWRHLVLYDAMTVQGWYMDLNRKVLASMISTRLRDMPTSG
jgi:hypothetical protein